MTVGITSGGLAAGSGVPVGGVSTTASWTPDGTSQYLLTITAYVSTGSAPPAISSISGNGLTWTLLASVSGDNTGADRTMQFLYAVPAGGSAGAVTINWSTVPGKAEWLMDKVTGADSGLGAGSLPQAAVTAISSGANPTATLGNALLTGSVTYAAVCFESSAGTLSAGTGYTLLGQNTGQSLCWAMTEWNSAGSTTAAANNSTTTNRHSIILIEIPVPNAAVFFDAASSSSAASTASLSWSHTCTGTDRVLLVDVALGINSGTDTAKSIGVTYNGVSMTSLGRRDAADGNTEGYIERFCLVAPATGANTVAVTVNSSSPILCGGAQSFRNASQTLSDYTVTSAASSGSSTAAAVTVTAPASTSMVMGGHGAGNTWGAVGQTSRYNVSGSTSTGCGCLCGNTAPGTGSNVTMSATVSAADAWVSFGTEVKIFSSSGTAYTANQTDAEGLTDTLTLVADYGRAQTDPEGLTDSVTLVGDYARTQTDALGLTDTATTTAGYARSATDALGLTDTLLVENGKALTQTDAEGLTDTVGLVTDFGRAQTDTEGLTDALTTALTAARNQTDAEGLTDTLTVASDFTRATTDSEGLTDTFATALAAGRVQTDPLGLTDTVGLVGDYGRTQTDPLGLTDTVTVQLAGAGTQTQTDTEGLTDTLTLAAGYARAQTDAEGLTDTVGLAAGYSRAATDLLGLTDAPVTALAAVRLRTDPLGLTDSVGLAVGLGRTDSVGLTDTLVLELIPSSLLPFDAPEHWTARTRQPDLLITGTTTRTAHTARTRPTPYTATTREP